MEEELSLDNILSTDEIDNLFTEDNNDVSNDTNQETEKETNKEETTEEVDANNLFAETPESVGSGEKENEEKEDTTQLQGGTSPKHFYSSIAKALSEEGIFPDLDDDSLSKIKSSEDFRDLIEQQINAGIDEKQKRISEALDVGVEPDDIKKYENTLDYLGSIKEEAIKEEGAAGEKLRKDLIYQDFINRGYSKERALREVQKSLNGGTDIEDATEALQSNIDYFNEQYNNLVNGAKEEAKRAEKERQKQATELRDSILNDKDVFGDLVVDKSTRQKIFENLAKPIYKDKETGQYYTALQKYEREHKTDFLKNLGLIFTLTNGFKNMDGLIKNKVKREVNKGLKNLETTLRNGSGSFDGNLQFMSGVSEDPESFIGKGWNIDV